MSMPYMAVSDSSADNADTESAIAPSESKSSLQDCFGQLINSLSALNPHLITQVLDILFLGLISNMIYISNQTCFITGGVICN